MDVNPLAPDKLYFFVWCFRVFPIPMADFRSPEYALFYPENRIVKVLIYIDHGVVWCQDPPSWDWTSHVLFKYINSSPVEEF